MFSGYSTSLICTSHGSQLPANTQSFKSFISSNAAFASTRLTEGFADAFVQRSAPESLNADTGTRFLITYSGFPPGAQLFVPDAIAGSDAIIPTSGGDLGEPASGGRYAPTTTGSLLLARVHNTDANGAGGSLAFVPGSPGSGVVNFDSMNQVVLDNGSGMLVYEVVDANPSAQESAQFPTYLGLAPFSGDPVITTEVVSFAPVSVITQATTHDPIPRFQALPPPADCHIIGDCGAFYYPKLFVNTTPLSFTATSGGGFQVGYFQVNNRGGGHLVWAVTISYTNGNGWLKLTPADGIDNSTVRVDADPGSLTAGMYEAVLTVDAGPQAGSMIVPVTFVVNAQPPPPPAPTVTSVVNAATFATGPAVAGSISTVTGQQLGGKNVVVGFDGTPGQVLFDSTKQINVVVPSSLGNKTSAQLVVIVDGSDSVPQTVPLAPFNPGIFSNGILNRDGTVNGSSHPAPPMSVLQIFATGLSGNGEITATLNGNAIATEYGGPAPGLPGVQQVNVQLPAGLPGSTAQVAVCGTVKGSQSTCSPAVQVMLAP